MMSARVSARSTAKLNAEKRMVRQREKEYEHQTKWNNQVQYYKSWEKNNKYEEWTSPRYYETNNEMIRTIKTERERKDDLEKRREKLKKLYEEENRTYDIEMMVRNRHRYGSSKSKMDMPTELLKDVHSGIKLEEDERKRHEAELALYHHWRNNNPVLREHERARSAKNVKFSWLDQQIEKRIERERAEEECRRLLAERDKRLEEEKEKEEQIKREIAEKNEKLRQDLEKQIEQLQLKQKQSEQLQQQEEEEMKNMSDLLEIEERRKVEEKLRSDREVALENLKRHKMKLKQRADDVKQNLEYERDMVKRLIDSEMADRIEDETKKREVKKAMSDFLKFAREQQDLERQRQKHFDFVFDSEAKLVYERQQQVWLEEQKAREDLLKSVLDTVKEQINEKMHKNKEQQRTILEQRQSALKLVEEYDQDIRKNKEEEQRKTREWKRGIEDQIKERHAIEKQERMLEQKQFDVELEAARKEEERLRREIVELQRRQGPIRHTRSRIFF